MSLLYKIGHFTGRFNVLSSSRNIINPIFTSYLKPLSHDPKHSVYFQGRLRPPADQKVKTFLGCIGNTRWYSLNNIPFDRIKGTKESRGAGNTIFSFPSSGSVFLNVPNINCAVTSLNSPHLIAASIPKQNNNSGNEINDGISSCKLSADDIESVKAALKPVIFSKCKKNNEFKDEGVFRKGLLKGFGSKNNCGSKWPAAKLDQQGQKRTFSNKINLEQMIPKKKMSNEQRIKDKIQLDKALCGVKIKTCNSKQLMSNIYHTESRTYAWVDGNTIMSSAVVNSPTKLNYKNTSGVFQSRYKNQFKPYPPDFDKCRNSVQKCDPTLVNNKYNNKPKDSDKPKGYSNKSESLKKYNKEFLMTMDPNQTDVQILEPNTTKDACLQEDNSAVPENEPQNLSSQMDLNVEDVEQEEQSKELCASENSIENENEITEYANSSITHIKLDSFEQTKAPISEEGGERKVEILFNSNRSRCKRISNAPMNPLTNQYFLDNLKDRYLYRGYKVRKYSTMTNYINNNNNSIECRKAKNKVVTIIGNKCLQLIGRPIPNVGDYDALIKVDSVAISGSDLHIYETGGKYLQNIALGHEASGTVQKIGKCVQHLLPGDKVAIEPGVPCGICDYCRSGKYNLCPETIFNGFFAKYCVHPADFCYKLPSDFNLEDAALIQPLAEGLHACQKGKISLHKNVLIIGACPLGLSSVIFARAMGASNITIIDTQEKNLCVAQELCSDREILVRDKIESETIRQILSGMTVHPDVVIDCWGCTKSMNISLISLKPGGICVLTSCQEECSNCTIMQALMKELQIVCSFRSANMYIPVINLISACKIDVSPMITHRFSIRDADSAFKTALMDKQCKAIKVLVKCWQ